MPTGAVREGQSNDHSKRKSPAGLIPVSLVSLVLNVISAGQFLWLAFHSAVYRLDNVVNETVMENFLEIWIPVGVSY